MAFETFNMAWPWIGLGIAAILLVLLFTTNIFRSNNEAKWKDLVWLAWLAVPVYMIHQFEEYALHVTNGQYDMVTMFYSDASPIGAIADMSALPLAHFPLMNIVFVWFAVPLAAWLCKRNPVIGLSGYGFILANGIVHVMHSVVLKMPIMENAGFFTGLFVFIPLTAWVIYVASKSDLITKKGLIVSLISGFVGHIALAGSYLFTIIGLPAGTLVADVFVSFAPIIVSAVLSRKLNVQISSK